jgi:hypothetical protein
MLQKNNSELMKKHKSQYNKSLLKNNKVITSNNKCFIFGFMLIFFIY